MDGFSVTGFALLPDGLVVLLRHARFVSIDVTQVDVERIDTLRPSPVTDCGHHSDEILVVLSALVGHRNKGTDFFLSHRLEICSLFRIQPIKALGPQLDVNFIRYERS